MKRNTANAAVLAALLLTSGLTGCHADADTVGTAPAETETAAAVRDSLRITEGGTHRLSGTYTGMILVDAGTEDVTLVLDGADVSSDGRAALYVKSAGSVTVTSADGSENRLAGKKGIHSQAALRLDGGGTLTVSAEEGHGIVTESTLTVNGGTYHVTATKDGIHAENDADPTVSDILITDGAFTIVSGGDGISASGTLTADGGHAVITAGGGAANAEPHTEEFFGRGFGFGGQNTESAAEEDGTSSKALKSDGDMIFNGGTFVLDSAEDTVHTNASLTVNGGEFDLNAGDDAFHADLALTVSDGVIRIGSSYEGIEAKTIDIDGGELRICASDDGFNASGGTGTTSRDLMAAEEGVYLRISGGTVFLDADGDGLDSNGDFYMTGGTVYAAGPENGANGAIDYAGDASAEGGTLIAAGASGMAESFGANSTQGAIMVNTGNQPAGSAVTLTDESGNVLAEYMFDKTFSNVVITCPGIADGGTYTVTAGTYSETITMDGLLYGSGGGMFGGMGGMNMGGMNMGGGRGAGGQKDRTEREEVPAMPEGEVPQMPEGEIPGMPAMPEGEMPQMPEGFDPGAMGGGRPGGMGMGGEPPQMP